MRQYLVGNDPDFVLGYDIIDDKLCILYGDNTIRECDYSFDKVICLDELMEKQHAIYNDDKSFADLSLDNILTSLFLGVVSGFLVVKYKSDVNFGVSSFTITTFVSSLIFESLKAKVAHRDYKKDGLLLENKEILELNLKDVSFLDSLPDGLRKKVINIHTGDEHLCLNAIADFSLRDMKNLVRNSTIYNDKALVRK